MEMELDVKTAGISCWRRTFELRETVEQALELVVPDTMPDVERILCTEGEALIRAKDCTEGKFSLSAAINVTLLYAPEGEAGLRRLNAALPVELERDAPGAGADTMPVIDLRLVSVDARMLNPRKLLIRAALAVTALGYAPGEQLFRTGPEGDDAAGIEVFKTSCRISPAVCVREKTFIVADEYRLPSGLPEPEDCIAYSIAPTLTGIRSLGTKLVFSGRVRVSVLYSAADNAEPYSAEFETEFSQMLETDTELNEPEAEVYIIQTAAYIEPGTLAEGGRGITAELHLVAQVVCMDTTEVSYLADCYCNSRELSYEREALTVEQLVKRTARREVISETAAATPPAAAVCRVSCTAGEARADAGRIKCPLTATVVYKDAEGRYYSALRRLTLDTASGMAEDEVADCVRVTCTEAAASPSREGLELRLGVDIELVSKRRVETSQVCAISLGDSRNLAALPSLIVLRGGENDSLWELSKQNCSTAGAIAAASCIEEGESIAGRLLLIPRVR